MFLVVQVHRNLGLLLKIYGQWDGPPPFDWCQQHYVTADNWFLHVICVKLVCRGVERGWMSDQPIELGFEIDTNAVLYNGASYVSPYNDYLSYTDEGGGKEIFL